MLQYSAWDIDADKEDVPYDGCYLGDYRNLLGMFFEYADVEGYDAQEVFTGLIKSDYKYYLDTCHPHYIGGCNTYEFAKYTLVERLGLSISNHEKACAGTDAYWWGWSIALVQWWFNITWDDMEKYCRLDIVKHLYHLGHEIDDMHVLDAYKTKLEMVGYPKELKDPWETRDYYLKKYGKET